MCAQSFVAINTSGQKPFTLHAHFTQAYRALGPTYIALDTFPTLLLTLAEIVQQLSSCILRILTHVATVHDLLLCIVDP